MDWYDQLEFFNSRKFDRITKRIKDDKARGLEVLPESGNILRAFVETPFDDVKVVILGQDPYPTPGHAMGLAFAVPNHTASLPPSLKNILMELEDDLIMDRAPDPNLPDLTRWARQGVLLLNTTLTVVAGQPASHSGIGWQALTNDVLRLLNEEKENLVFILWGNHARKKGMFIDTSKHLVIESPHPSPLSAYRGFFGSRPFSRTNKYLEEHGIEPIVW